MGFRCPNTQAHYNKAVVYLKFGTPESNEFSIWNKWKNLLFLGVPILKHIRVSRFLTCFNNWKEKLIAEIIWVFKVRVNACRRSNSAIFIFSLTVQM